MPTITGLTARDIRFPTSRALDGSDAMNPDPDYSAAYVVLHTDQPGLEGYGLTFTIGRGNELCVAAARSLAHLVVGLDLETIAADMGGFWRMHYRRQPAALGRPRERRDSSRHRRRRQRGVGPMGQGGGQTAVEAAGGHDTGAVRVLYRLSLHHGRDHA